MRKFLLTVCLIVILATFQVLAQSAKKWAIETSTTATTLVGVGIASPDLAIGAAATNGAGALAEIYNGTAWSKTSLQGGLLMDAAISKSGLAVATSMLQVVVSTDGGATFTTAAGVSGLSQSASLFGPNGDIIGLVGGFVVRGTGLPTSVSGVATSKDSGATWTVSSNVPLGSVRYGAFPSENTWYVSSGMWPADSSNEKYLSSRAVIRGETVSFVDKKYGVQKRADGTTGWWGAVSKTTDGGKTWSQVFLSDYEKDAFYFNGISCSSDSHCVVVGEGEDAAGASLSVALSTFDGGATWQRTIEGKDASMMGVDFVSETEGWVAATQSSGRTLSAVFYHTLDGGKTFTIDETLKNCFVLDVDYEANGNGIASCASSSGSSCSAALYH